MFRILATVMLLLPLPALAHEFKAGDLVIDHPKIIEMPPGAKVAAGYLSVANSGSEDDTLLEIESAAVPRVEMHASAIADGVARMRRMDDGLKVPAGKTVALGENGTHAMFMDLGRQLKAGEKIEAVLVFEKAGRVNVVFNVEKRIAGNAGTHEQH